MTTFDLQKLEIFMSVKPIRRINELQLFNRYNKVECCWSMVHLYSIICSTEPTRTGFYLKILTFLAIIPTIYSRTCILTLLYLSSQGKMRTRPVWGKEYIFRNKRILKGNTSENIFCMKGIAFKKITWTPHPLHFSEAKDNHTVGLAQPWDKLV